MGTSSIYEGPKDKNPLLPDDYNEELVDDDQNLRKDNDDQITKEENDNQENDESNENDIINDEDSKPWQAVKTAMSKHINGNGGSNGVKNITRGYIKASGGSSALINSSISGIRSTINLRNILSSFQQNGVANTLEQLNIKYTGKNVKVILSELVNIISFKSNTKEDIVAKKATINALADIYEYIEKNDMDITCLESISQEMMDKVLCSYIGAYIWGRMLNDLQSRFEKYSNDAKKTIELEKEFKLYINNSVKMELRKGNIDGSFQNQNIDEVITNLYSLCFKALEGSI